VNHTQNLTYTCASGIMWLAVP